MLFIEFTVFVKYSKINPSQRLKKCGSIPKQSVIYFIEFISQNIICIDNKASVKTPEQLQV